MGFERPFFWTPREKMERVSNPGDRRRIFTMHPWITPPPPHSPHILLGGKT